MGAARIPWAAVGADGEGRLLDDGISVRCLLREDGVDAIVARAY